MPPGSQGRQFPTASQSPRQSCCASRSRPPSLIAEVKNVGDDDKKNDQQMAEELRSHAPKSVEIFWIGIRAAIFIYDEFLILGRPFDCAEQAGNLARDIRVQLRGLHAGISRDNTEPVRIRGHRILDPLLRTGIAGANVD